MRSPCWIGLRILERFSLFGDRTGDRVDLHCVTGHVVPSVWAAMTMLNDALGHGSAFRNEHAAIAFLARCWAVCAKLYLAKLDLVDWQLP